MRNSRTETPIPSTTLTGTEAGPTRTEAGPTQPVVIPAKAEIQDLDPGSESGVTKFVYSTEFGTSADVFPKILGLYVRPGSTIADLTYGRGVFWRKVNLDQYTLLPSDQAPSRPDVLQMDARHTGYEDASLHVVVLDPPYGNMSTRPRRDGIQRSYNLASLMTPDAIKLFYGDALDEAFRILAPRGILIVKCQDFVDGGKQHWMTELIYVYAARLGMRGEGKINMVPPARPIMRHPDRPQQHERKNHSTFWIFRKARR